MRHSQLILAGLVLCVLAVSSPCLAEITVLAQEGQGNITNENFTMYRLKVPFVAEAVKLTAPKPDWSILGVEIFGTSGWNASRELPPEMLFSMEIRDEKLRLLYKTIEPQLDYFLFEEGLGYAYVDIPQVKVTGDFYVCFYDRASVLVGAELNGTQGNSFIYDRNTNELYPATIEGDNNTTIPVNWVIRAVGE